MTKIIDYSERAIAVVGDTKPIKDELRKLGGKFNARLSCGAGWIFSAKKRAEVEKLLAGETTANPTVQVETKKEVRNDKEFLEEYMTEIRKAWEGDMLDYFRKRFSSAIKLTNGGLIVFEKPSIQTSFCFGYHTHDDEGYKRANEMADYASKSEDYFLSRNLAEYDRKIKAIETGESDRYSCQEIYIYRAVYGDNENGNVALNVWKYGISSHWDYERAKEDGARYGAEHQLINDTDKAALLDGLKHERAKFEKRLKSYLKRYGTSKLNTWSFWADR